MYCCNFEIGVFDIVVDMFEESGMDDFCVWVENYYDEIEVIVCFNDEVMKYGFVDFMW